MSVILILIGASLTMAILALGAFVWAVTRGQYEDTHTPSMRVLMEDKTGGKSKRADANTQTVEQPPDRPTNG